MAASPGVAKYYSSRPRMHAHILNTRSRDQRIRAANNELRASSPFLLDPCENPVRLDAPVCAAGKLRRALRSEHALIGKISHPGLPLGGALRRPRRQARLAHGLGDLAHFLGTTAAMLD